MGPLPIGPLPMGRLPGPYLLRDISDAQAYEGDWPRRLNDRGDVLMYSGRLGGVGGIAAPPAACRSTRAINNLSQVLCSLATPTPPLFDRKVSSYAIWNGSTLTPLASVDTFPADFQAWTLNDSGEVVGTMTSASFTNPDCPVSCGVIWRAGQPTFLPVSAYHTIQMNNKRDLLVQDVEMYTSSVRLYESATVQVRQVGDGNRTANDMNDQGWVVGTLLGDRWTARSIAYISRPEGITLLGTGEANGIDDAGNVVGVLDGRAVMWKGGTPLLLTFAASDTSWTVTRARAINNRGQIAAQADDSANAKFNRAVILTPISR